jgi:DhnA family fructose-bisphosphate aldolase class Ia
VKRYRLARLFNPRSGRCFDVAVDHGFFGEASFLRGIEDMPGAVQTLIAAAPDAIQLTVGQAHLLQGSGGRERPALVLRTDIANVYGQTLPDRLYSRMIADAARQAVRLDAACVVVNLFDIPGQPALREACIENILRLKPACDELALPVMIEPLVMRPNEEAGGYMVDGDADRIVTLVRQAAELGADVIKADPTDDVTQYGRVVQAAGVPVLVRGGGRVSDDELFRRTRAVLEQGAAGIVYGRNVIQHANPGGLVRALMAMVHDGATPDAALELLARS